MNSNVEAPVLLKQVHIGTNYGPIKSLSLATPDRLSASDKDGTAAGKSIQRVETTTFAPQSAVLASRLAFYSAYTY